LPLLNTQCDHLFCSPSSEQGTPGSCSSLAVPKSRIADHFILSNVDLSVDPEAKTYCGVREKKAGSHQDLYRDRAFLPNLCLTILLSVASDGGKVMTLRDLLPGVPLEPGV
jgi:hypothetical protein